MRKLFFAGILFATTAASAALPEHSLFVVMGGRTSCGNGSTPSTGIGMYRPFKKMVAELTKRNPNARIDYLVSCLNSSPPPNAEAPYLTSEDPKKSKQGNANVLQREIQRLAGKHEDTQIFIIGHSYGGWLSMYLTERTSLKGAVSTLFTVDPISTLCGPMEYLFGSEECHQAPRDRDNAAILRNVRRWVNFYQDQDSMLRSSAIKDAAANHRIEIRGPHTEIDNNAQTWQIIQQEVTGVRPSPFVVQK